MDITGLAPVSAGHRMFHTSHCCELEMLQSPPALEAIPLGVKHPTPCRACLALGRAVPALGQGFLSPGGDSVSPECHHPWPGTLGLHRDGNQSLSSSHLLPHYQDKAWDAFPAPA